jgi:hypothetical protein
MAFNQPSDLSAAALKYAAQRGAVARHFGRRPNGDNLVAVEEWGQDFAAALVSFVVSGSRDAC